jgi:hypothetical protein
MHKKTNRPSPGNGPAFEKINWDDPKMHLPSPNNCGECKNNFYSFICRYAAEIARFTVDHKITFFTDIINKMKLVNAIFCKNDIDYYELKRNIELEILKQEQLTAENEMLSYSVTKLLGLLGVKRIHAKGTNREIGIKLGWFFYHTRNSKKELMFNIEAVDLASFVEVMIETPEGKSVKHHSMEGYIGEGRNS